VRPVKDKHLAHTHAYNTHSHVYNARTPFSHIVTYLFKHRFAIQNRINIHASLKHAGVYNNHTGVQQVYRHMVEKPL